MLFFGIVSWRTFEINDSRTKVLAKYFICSDVFRNRCIHVLSCGTKDVRKERGVIIFAVIIWEKEGG